MRLLSVLPGADSFLRGGGRGPPVRGVVGRATRGNGRGGGAREGIKRGPTMAARATAHLPLIPPNFPAPASSEDTPGRAGDAAVAVKPHAVQWVSLKCTDRTREALFLGMFLNCLAHQPLQRSRWHESCAFWAVRLSEVSAGAPGNPAHSPNPSLRWGRGRGPNPTTAANSPGDLCLTSPFRQFGGGTTLRTCDRRHACGLRGRDQPAGSAAARNRKQ
jgi:hypothetical protein